MPQGETACPGWLLRGPWTKKLRGRAFQAQRTTGPKRQADSMYKVQRYKDRLRAPGV